jgi:hypothetical protein
MVLVLVDINMKFEAQNTNFKASNLPMPSGEGINERMGGDCQESKETKTASSKKTSIIVW